MKVILVEGSVSIEFIDTGKKVQVDNKVISEKLSEVGPSMGTMLFLMRLPYIKEIAYSKKKRTVSYEFYAGEISYRLDRHKGFEYVIPENREYIHDVDESIIKVFDWCESIWICRQNMQKEATL